MVYSVFYSEEFEEHIFEIEYYYRNFESDSRAEKVLKSIIKCIESIQKQPEMFPFETSYKFVGNRKAVVHQTFVIYFKIMTKTDIMIIDIIHGKINI